VKKEKENEKPRKGKKETKFPCDYWVLIFLYYLASYLMRSSLIVDYLC